jgi:aspartyl-tRNA(Asn)/glutamyl-tRNA(Gln) amidotransferase subunit C
MFYDLKCILWNKAFQLYANLQFIILNFKQSEVLKLDLKMVSYLSKLSKLNFTDDELEQVAQDMTSIIEIMDTIKEIDIKYDALADNKNVYINDLREDVMEESMPTEKILKNAVNSDNCFVVPKVVE